MRLAGIAQLRDVAWAILEPRGKISFIQRIRRRRRGATAAAEERGGRRRRLSGRSASIGRTMTSRWTDELAFATDLARRAGALLTDSYERLERIDYKSKRDVVTNADYASERLVIDAIKARFPGDAILAEESGEHAGVLRDDGSHNGRTWVIDPLDGTVNYANGIPYYCVSIGLVVDDRPTVGVDPRPCPRRPVHRHGRRPGQPRRRAGRGPRRRRRSPTTS